MKLTCTRHGETFDASEHKECPQCEAEGVVSLSAARERKMLENLPIFICFDLFNLNLPWERP